MGVLEQLLAEQQKTNLLLEEMCRALGKTPTVTLESTATVAEEAVSSTEVETTDDASVAEVETELDKDGVPWDERIHSSNGKKTSKGVWMKKRGVSDAEHAKITAELKADTVTDGVPAAPATPDVPKTPATPPAPGGNVPAAPATPDQESTGFKKQAKDAIDRLLDNNGMEFEVMIDYFVSQFNVTGFDQLTPIQWEVVVRNMAGWQEDINTIKDVVNQIKDIYIADVSVIEPHITAVFGQIDLNGVPVTGIENTPYTQRDTVLENMQQLLASCQQAAQ